MKNTLLYDFYGELLTEHQRKIYESVVFEDLSLAEAAEQARISRQGVHDIIRRCNASMEDFEQRLHLMERFLQLREKAERIRAAAQKEPADLETVRKTIDEMLEEL